MTGTKGRLKQFGKMLCYALLYYGMLQIFALAVFIGYEIILSVQYGSTHTGPVEQSVLDQLYEETLDFYMRNNGWITVATAISTMLILWAFFAIRKKKILEEISFRPIDKKWILPVVLIAFGAWLVVEFGLCLLPIPEEMWEEYGEAAEFLDTGSLIQNILAFSVFGPIIEEIIFRGLGFFRLRKAWSVWTSVFLSSFLFGILHNGNWIWIAYATLIGVILSIVAWRTNSIKTTILIHMIFNFMGDVTTILIPEEISGIVIICAFVIGVILLVFSFRMLFHMTETQTNWEGELTIHPSM